MGDKQKLIGSDGKTYNGVSTSRTIPLTGTGVTQVIKLSNIIYANSKKELRFIPDSYQNSYTMTVSF